MKQNDNKNSEFENMLRNKMDELASSVDCFDKISKKAFPDTNISFSENETTISSLENVTGRKKHFRLLPAAALAVAFALCIFFLPKNERFMNFVYSNIANSSDSHKFRDLINEINEETKEYDYSYFDCSLDDYINHDLLITPLYNCPFEQKIKDNINVRIYVKMHGDIPTNHIYVVEYEGAYAEGNYIAAADSKAKISKEELDALGDTNKFFYSPETASLNTASLDLIQKNFSSDDENGGFIDSSGTPTSIAGFNYNCIYKSDEQIYWLSNEIIYYHKTDENYNEYSYDINSYTNNYYDTKYITPPFVENSWDNVLYYNGSSARATRNLSAFNKTQDFISINDDSDILCEVDCIMPFDLQSEAVIEADMSETIIYTYDNNKMSSNTSIIIPPVNPALKQNFRIYLPGSNSNIELKSSDNLLNGTFQTFTVTVENESTEAVINKDAAEDALKNEEAANDAKIESERVKQIELEFYQAHLIELQGTLENELAAMQKLEEGSEKDKKSADIMAIEADIQNTMILITELEITIKNQTTGLDSSN